MFRFFSELCLCLSGLLQRLSREKPEQITSLYVVVKFYRYVSPATFDVLGEAVCNISLCASHDLQLLGDGLAYATDRRFNIWPYKRTVQKLWAVQKADLVFSKPSMHSADSICTVQTESINCLLDQGLCPSQSSLCPVHGGKWH